MVLFTLFCLIGGKVTAQVPPTVTINVTPLPVITFNTPLNACEGAVYNLAQLQTLVVNSITQGASAGNVVFWTNAGDTTPVSFPYEIPAFNTGTVTLYAQAKDGTNSCDGDIQEFTITINEIPAGAIAGMENKECNGQTTTLTFNKTSAGNIASYAWSMKSGPATATFNPANASSTTASWTNVGVGVVQVELTGSNGCFVTVETAVNAINVQETPVLTDITPTTAVCSGVEVEYATLNTNTNIGEGSMAYAWTVTPISNVAAVTVPSVIATADIALTQTATSTIGVAGTTGSATIRVTGTANGCSVSKTVDITVNPMPIAELFINTDKDSETVCNITGGQILKFTVNTGNGLETSPTSTPYQITYNKVIGSSSSSGTTAGANNNEKSWTFEDTIAPTNETVIKYIVTQVTNGVCTRTYTVTP